MTIIQLLIAIILPWLTGSTLTCLLGVYLNDPLPKAIILGYGYLLGIVMTTLMMRVLPLSAGVVCSTIVIICCSMMALIWQQSKAEQSDAKTKHQNNTYKFSWALVGQIIIIAISTVHLYLIAINVSIKPLFAWDSWATWSVKARTWFELKQIVAFGDRTTWLSGVDNSLHALDAWNYPDTVPLIQTWVALMIDQWDDSLVNIPWVFCFISLGIGFYGQLKFLEISNLLKAVGVYLIISLPLVNTHVALAGYADLWLCSAYTLTVLALIQSLITKSRSQLALAILAMFCVALFKTEGVVLLLTLLPIWIVVKSPSTILTKLAIISCVAILAMIGAITLFSPIELNLPYLGKFLINYHSVWDAVIINYFELPSWHLLGYLTVIGFLYSCFTKSLTLLQRKLVLTPLITLVGYLFVLFFLTQNYTWAQQYSSINRITLHLLPSILFCLLLIFDKRFKNCHMLSKMP